MTSGLLQAYQPAAGDTPILEAETVLDQFLEGRDPSASSMDHGEFVRTLVNQLVSAKVLDSEAIARITVVLETYPLALNDLAARGDITEEDEFRLKREALTDIHTILSQPTIETLEDETSNLLSDCQSATALLAQAIAAIDATMAAIGNPGCDAWATEVWYKLQSARVNLPNLLKELGGDPRPCSYYTSMYSRFEYAKGKAHTAWSYGSYSSCLSSSIQMSLSNIYVWINNAAYAAANCCDGSSYVNE
jgi:hypothetical protein